MSTTVIQDRTSTARIRPRSWIVLRMVLPSISAASGEEPQSMQPLALHPDCSPAFVPSPHLLTGQKSVNPERY